MNAQHQVMSGFFVACCTFYFCVGVTCRLVPVRWVGVQLYPAAHWQQKQRLSLEDSHIERLRFSPLLTFLRDSQWGIYTSVTSPLHPVGSFSRSALLCLLDLLKDSKLTLLSPALQHICSQSPLRVRNAAFSASSRSCRDPSAVVMRRGSFLMCNNRMKQDLSLLRLIKAPQMGSFNRWRWNSFSVHSKPSNLEKDYPSFISHTDS